MKSYNIMKGFDPRAVGFMCGLEVHQQLITDHKLFCKCPAGAYSEEYSAHVVRHMRPTLSELGEYDGTALMEFKTHKEIIYRLHKDSVCTYEMDDNPPFFINRQAVDIAIEVALLFNCSIVDEIHVVRKQYLDGSIPAGFQRTAIIGWQGWMPFGDRKIHIRQVAVEEDSCREVSDNGHRRIYMTDRLSIPLIEVVTDPEILTPEEAFEVSKQIGRITRSTGKVRRGIGRVRQDVNVSVTGGTRIEIKGVPRQPQFPALVHNEAYRQHRLLVLRDLLLARNITKDNIVADQYDMTETLRSAIPVPADHSVEKIGVVVLRGMAGLLAHPIGPTRVFADDIAGRIRVIACLSYSYPLMYTDDLSEKGLKAVDRAAIVEHCRMTAQDSAAIVWGDARDVDTALKEVEIRIREATVGIPSETRQALANGETGFERILPGPDRMYPDTDSPPLAITREDVAAIQARLPKLPWERVPEYRKLGLPEQFVNRMAESGWADLFEKATGEHKSPPVLTAVVLLDLLRHYHRCGGNLATLNNTLLEELFVAYKQNRFSSHGFRLILESAAESGSTDWQAIIDRVIPPKINAQQLSSVCTHAIEEAKKKSCLDRPAQSRMAMGIVMEKLYGRIDGKNLAEQINGMLG